MGTRAVNKRTEPFDVYIGRPSVWGNPYQIGRDGSRDEVIAKYEAFLRGRPDLIERARRDLKGRRLGCFCSPAPCHGDVLARAAEGEFGQGEEH